MPKNVSVLSCVKGKSRFIKEVDEEEIDFSSSEEDDDDDDSEEELGVHVTKEGGVSGEDEVEPECGPCDTDVIPSCVAKPPPACPIPPPTCLTPSPSGCPPRSPTASCLTACPVPSLTQKLQAFMMVIAEFQDARRELVESIMDLAPPSEFVEEV